MLDVQSVAAWAAFSVVVVAALLIVLWFQRREHDQEISNLEEHHRAVHARLVSDIRRLRDEQARLSGEYMKLRDRERAWLDDFRGTVDSHWADWFVEKHREKIFSSVKDQDFESVWWKSEI